MAIQNNKKFFKQVISVEKETRNLDRIEFLKNQVKNKTVLHVGFADYPITDKLTNVHLELSNHCKILDGIDPNVTDDIIDQLSVKNGKIFTSWDDVPTDYEIILVPEVIEHVDNVREFIKQFDKFSGKLIITAPCVFYHRDKSFREYEDCVVEMVHPDHNCWYSPYTLKNVVEKYSNKTIETIHMLTGSVAVVCK